MVVDLGLRAQMERRIQGLEDARRVKTSSSTVRIETIENYHARATAGDFEFDADEPTSKVGGTNHGPRPLDYFIAGFGFCLQAQIVRNAILMEIELDDLAIEVTRTVDPSDGVGITPGPAAFVDTEVDYRISLQTPAPADAVERLIEEAERCCYAHGTLSQPASMNREVVLNEEPLEL